MTDRVLAVRIPLSPDLPDTTAGWLVLTETSGGREVKMMDSRPEGAEELTLAGLAGLLRAYDGGRLIHPMFLEEVLNED